MKLRSIAVFNQAGGVGKTSLTRDLGYELSLQGKRVLLVDADSQGSLSEFLNLEPFQKTDEEMFWGAVIRHAQQGGPFTPPLHEAFGMSVGISNFGLIEHEELIARERVPWVFLDALE